MSNNFTSRNRIGGLKMLEEYKTEIIDEINYLEENLEILPYKEIKAILEKIKKLIELNELQKDVTKIFYYYIKHSYNKEQWQKAIEANDIISLIYLTKYFEQQEEFFKRNMNNLENVLFVFKRVLEKIKDEEREEKQENEENEEKSR